MRSTSITAKLNAGIFTQASRMAAAMFLISAGLLLSGVSMVVNPYADVDWTQAEQHLANLHTHTTQSDGWLTPNQVIDEYHARGYTILSLTEHNLCTWPWTELATIERKGRAMMGDRAAARKEAGDTAATAAATAKLDDDESESAKDERAPLIPPYENRAPEALGMLAIAGNEVSVHHHMCALFIHYETKSRDLDQTLREVAEAGGLAVINHPGRYWKKDDAGEIPEDVLQKYIALFREHEVAVGAEVINQGMRYKDDIELWDKILAVLMPERPVWGYANDDMHAIGALGRDASMFLLPALSEAALRDAMKHGRSYMRTVSTHERTARNMQETPIIKSIRHDAEAGIITIEATSGGKALPDDRYQWIAEGKTVHTGPSINYRSTEGIGNYARAEIRGDGGTAFTNPFGFAKP